ncbi:MAG: molybdopterin cofactor-binding domain-containing protein, partial [Gemmatimonadaceae bacterium]
MKERVTAPSLGEPIDRVDGRLKVTGGARYAAEIPVAGAAHAVIVTSSVPKGLVVSMDASSALRVAGVRAVLTPFNAPRVTVPPATGSGTGEAGSGRRMRVPTVLQNTEVHYNGQPIGLVVADTIEAAMEAALLVKTRYATEAPVLDMSTAPKNPPESVHPLGGERTVKRGDVDAGLRDAATHIEHEYSTPLENHNPMEMHNTVAIWEGDHLTLY